MVVEPRIESRTLLFARLAPWLTFVPAAIAFLVWLTEAYYPTTSNLFKCNTALSLTLGSLGALLIQRPHLWGGRSRRVAMLLALGAFAIGLETTVEYIFHVNLGLDEILVKDTHSSDSLAFPGRMSPISSMSLLLLGLGLITHGKTWDRERSASISALVLIPLFIISLFTTIGHIYKLDSFYHIGPYVRIAWPTSVAFLILSVALLLSQCRLSPMRILMSAGVGGMTARRLLPLMIALPITLSWFGLVSERLGYLGEEFAVSLLGMIMVIMLMSIFLYVARNMDRLYFREMDLKEKERRSSEKLAQVLEATQLATFEWNIERETLTWNSYHERLFGYPIGQGDHVAADFNRRVHPDDLQRVMEAAGKATENKSEFDVDYRIILPNGKLRWLYCKGHHFVDEQSGEPLVRGTVIDITERKLAEQQTQEIQFKLNFALNAANIGYWTFAIDSDEVHVSQTLMDDWGIDPATFNETKDECLAFIHSEDRARVSAGFDEAIRSKSALNCEYRVVRPSGEIVWIAARGNYFSDERHGKHQMTGITVNITERKTAVEELHLAKEQAESASRSKSAFLANMSHEIRTPLGVMLGFTDLITNPEISEADKMNFASTLKRNGEQLTMLINDILDLSKVEAGQMKIERVPFSLSALVTDTVSALKVKADEKGLALKFSIENEFSDRVLSDAIRIKQILWNLIGNGIKFTPSGEVSLRIRRFKDRLEMEIRDTGIGIPEHTRDALFRPFSQADESITRKFGGTGLGLALSKRLAELLGGELFLKWSVVGRGSVFALTVHDYSIENGLNSVSLNPVVPISPGPETQECLRGIRVLLVDDSPDNQDLIARVLSLRGALVETADNGRLGVEKAMRGRHDVVLMDVQMPVLDGLSATTMLRTVGYATPIIALTAHAMSEVRKQCLDAGSSEYLSKPVNARELVRKILLLTSRRKRPAIVNS